MAYLVAALVTGYVTVRLGRRADIGLPTATVLAAAGAAVTGVLTRWRATEPPRERTTAGARPEAAQVAGSGPGIRPARSATAALVTVLALAVAVVGAPWWVGGRHVDGTTTDRPAPVPAAGPDHIGGVVWSATADEVWAAGPYAVIERDEGDDDVISVIESATGQERWRFRRRHGGASAAVSARDEVVVVSTAVDDDLREFVALDLRSGRQLWRQRQRAWLLTVIDDLVLLGRDEPGVPSQQEDIVAVRATTGREVWRSRTALDPGCAESWRRSDDVLVGPSDCTRDELAGVAWSSGEAMWEAAIESASMMERESILTIGDVVMVKATVASQSDNAGNGLVAIDATSGRELWRRTDMSWWSRPVAVGRHAVVSIGSGAGDELRALDPRSGETVWTTTLADVVDPDEGAVIETDGSHVYVATGTSEGEASTVAVVDADGELVETAQLPGCGRPCADGLLIDTVTGSALLPGSGVLMNVGGRRIGPTAAEHRSIDEHPRTVVAIG